MEAVGALQRAGDVVDAPLRIGLDLPVHLEILVRPDGAVLARQVADMAVAGEDRIVRAEILVDGLRLGRRFADDALNAALFRSGLFTASPLGRASCREGG